VPFSTFLNIFGVSIGFLSALYFALGTLRLRTKDIVGIAGTYWDFNQHLADSIASQRAEYIAGALLLLMSFTLQFAANLVPPTLQPSQLQSFGCAFSAIGLALLAIAVLSWLLCRSLAAKTKAAVRKELQPVK
jgi:hypothetical protein